MRSELVGLPGPNWFHHGAAVLALLDCYRPTRLVELGSNRGCSAIAMARTVRAWGGVLTCVDCWDGRAPGYVDVGTFLQNVTEAGVADAIVVVRSDSVEAAAKWQGPLDFLYVDADHTREGCLADLRAWWPLLRDGGVLAGDDYDDVAGDPVRGVTAAWDEFEQEQQQTFIREKTSATAYHGRLIWGVKR